MMKVWKPTPEEVKVTDNWETWSKEASEFSWSYDDKESCYILQGEAIATDSNGNSILFKAGDMVQFDKGLKCIWKIKQDLKKKYKFG